MEPPNGCLLDLSRTNSPDPALCQFPRPQNPHYGENSRDLTPSGSQWGHTAGPGAFCPMALILREEIVL